jgi:hypothetical protein
MLVTLPFVLLLLDYWPLDRLASEASHSRLRTCLNLILEKVPFLLLSAAICVITVLTQKNAVVIGRSSTFFWRVGNALLAYTDYLETHDLSGGFDGGLSPFGNEPVHLECGLSALILVRHFCGRHGRATKASLLGGGLVVVSGHVPARH